MVYKTLKQQKKEKDQRGKMDLQTIILSISGVVAITFIVLQVLIFRKLSSVHLGHHHTKNFVKKLEEACESNDNPFENIDNFVVRLGDGFGKIYIVENKITKQHFLFSKDFSIAEWKK